jgi:hypothetical protein
MNLLLAAAWGAIAIFLIAIMYGSVCMGAKDRDDI